MMRVPALVLASMLILNGTLGGVAIAQVANDRDNAQDAAAVVESDRQDTNTAQENTRQDTAAGTEYNRQDKQTQKNSDDIEKLNELTATQKFVIQMATIVLPLLSLIATGIIGLLQLRAKKERHVLADEQRSNLHQMAKSINGVKTELVAMTEAKAFLEGVTAAAIKTGDPELAKLVQQRAAELNVKVELAGKEAANTAEEAAASISNIPDEVKAIHPK